MWAGEAWSFLARGRRLCSRPWRPPERLVGSLFVLHAAQSFGPNSKTRPWGPEFRGVRGLAELTEGLRRAGEDVSYDPVRREIVGDDVRITVRDFPRGAFAVARLESVTLNPELYDLAGWSERDPRTHKDRAWAKPRMWGLLFGSLVPIPQRVCFASPKIWPMTAIDLARLNEALGPDDRENVRALVEICREPDPEPPPPAKRPVDWSTAKPPHRFQGWRRRICYFCGDVFQRHEMFVMSPCHRRMAHVECAPGIGRPIGDTGGRHVPISFLRG